MKTLSLDEVVIDFDGLLETVCNGAERVCIESGDMKVVMMSLAEYEALQETIYLLGNKTNAKRLMESVGELEK